MGRELDICGLRSQVWTGDRMEVIRTRAGWADQPGNAVGTGPSPHVNFPRGGTMKGTQEVQPRRDRGRPWLSSTSLDQANARHADRARARASGVRRRVGQVC